MNSTHEFRPESISRRGEWMTWVLTVISLAALAFLHTQTAQVSIWYYIFVLFMLFTAASISLSNWMDRNTVLTLKPDGIDFRNGLRNVSLQWDQLSEVRVFPSRFGKQVYIQGEFSHFNFRTLSVLERKGEVRNQMGFAQGEHIIQQILTASRLEQVDQSGKGNYYARP
jgi:hypothetical protein